MDFNSDINNIFVEVRSVYKVKNNSNEVTNFEGLFISPFYVNEDKVLSINDSVINYESSWHMGTSESIEIEIQHILNRETIIDNIRYESGGGRIGVVTFEKTLQPLSDNVIELKQRVARGMSREGAMEAHTYNLSFIYSPTITKGMGLDFDMTINVEQEVIGKETNLEFKRVESGKYQYKNDNFCSTTDELNIVLEPSSSINAIDLMFGIFHVALFGSIALPILIIGGFFLIRFISRRNKKRIPQ